MERLSRFVILTILRLQIAVESRPYLHWAGGSAYRLDKFVGFGWVWEELTFVTAGYTHNDLNGLTNTVRYYNTVAREMHDLRSHVALLRARAMKLHLQYWSLLNEQAVITLDGESQVEARINVLKDALGEAYAVLSSRASTVMPVPSMALYLA